MNSYKVYVHINKDNNKCYVCQTKCSMNRRAERARLTVDNTLNQSYQE